MGYNRDQILQMYNTRMKSVLTGIQRDREEEDAIAYNEQVARKEKMAQASMAIAALDMGLKTRDRFLTTKLAETYGDDSTKAGLFPKKFEMKEGAKWYNLPEHLKRTLLPGTAIKEQEGYTKFKEEQELEKTIKTIGKSKDPSFDEKSLAGWINPETGEQGTAAEWDKLVSEKGSEYAQQQLSEEARETVPIAEELAVDEPLATIQDDEEIALSTSINAPAYSSEDLKNLDESAKRSLYEQYYQGEAEGLHPERVDEIPDYQTWLGMTEEGELSGKYTKKIQAPPDKPIVPVAEEDEFTMPWEEDIVKTSDDLTMPPTRPAKEYDTEELKRKALTALETKPGVVPEVSADRKLERALREMETDVEKPSFLKKSLQTLIPGGSKGFLEKGGDVGAMTAGAGTMIDGVDTQLLYDKAADVDIPDAVKPDLKTTGGKIVSGAQDIAGAVGQLKTLTGEGTKEEKAIAGTQLAGTVAKKTGELVTKKAGEEVGKKGFGKVLGAVGKGLGAGVGIYTGLKTAFSEEATGEQRVGGGLQAVGSALIGTGIGAGLGAILAGGGALLSMFGGGGKKAAPPPKRKIATSKYYQRRRSY